MAKNIKYNKEDKQKGFWTGFLAGGIFGAIDGYKHPEKMGIKKKYKNLWDAFRDKPMK